MARVWSFLFLVCGVVSLQSFSNGNALAAGNPDISGCSPHQEAVLRKADFQVNRRLDQLVEELKKFDVAYIRKNYLDLNNRAYVSHSVENGAYAQYLSKLETVFEMMRESSNEGIHFKCRKSDDNRRCQKGEVWAYVLYVGSYTLQNIYICPTFFTKSAKLQNETLMHELSHYAARTDDLASSWQEVKNPDLSQAPNDAFHIEKFMDGDTAGTLQAQVWQYNWSTRLNPTLKPSMYMLTRLPALQ